MDTRMIKRGHIDIWRCILLFFYQNLLLGYFSFLRKGLASYCAAGFHMKRRETEKCENILKVWTLRYSVSLMSNQPLKYVGSITAKITRFLFQTDVQKNDSVSVFWFWCYCCRWGSIICDTVVDVTWSGRRRVQKIKIYMSHDLWKPASRTSRTIYI